MNCRLLTLWQLRLIRQGVRTEHNGPDMNPHIDFKLIITDSVQFFLQNLRQIAALCLPFLLAGTLFNNIVLAGGGGSDETGVSSFMLATMVNLALNPIYTAALILMMAGRAARQQPRNSELVSAAMGRYVPLLLLTLVQMGLMWMGILMMVIPGIWIAVRLSFSDFFLVLEGMDPREAIVRSFQMTKRFFFPILIALALFALPLFALGMLMNNLLAASQADKILMVIIDTTIGFMTLFLHVIMFRIFMEAKRHEGFLN